MWSDKLMQFYSNAIEEKEEETEAEKKIQQQTHMGRIPC